MNRSFLSAVVLASTLIGCSDDDEHAELEQIIDELEQQVEELQAQLATANEQLTTKTAELATRTQERDALKAERDSFEARLAPEVTLEVPLYYGNAALVLGASYPLSGGGNIAFREVRYWLSNVELQKADLSWVTVPDAYYLIEARPEQPLTNGTEAEIALPAKRRETVDLKGIPSGSYVAIRFNIGVDAAHNDDLSNTAGELGSLKNMTFDNGWMWFTSYKFTRTVADTDTTNDTAEVSWDNGSNNDLRQVTLPFASAVALEGAQTYAIKLKADLEGLVTDVSPTTNPTINATTPEARTALADAFRDMFTMVAVDQTTP
jgi:outer membrane murein-binding lipoprotein Lpp